MSGRYPDGGGVVSVAGDAFGPIVGCLGGMLISVDYFLTGAISTVSGFQYLSAAIPSLQSWLVPCACASIISLGLLNIIGIRESATLTALLAISSLLVNLVVLITVAVQLDAQSWRLVADQFKSVRYLQPAPLAVGFASLLAGVFGPRVDQPDRPGPARAAPANRPARDDAGGRLHPDHLAADDRVQHRSAAAAAGEPGAVRFRPGGRIRPGSPPGGHRAHRLHAAHGGGQHRHHRLLSRVPRARAARLLAGLAGRAEPPVQYPPPGHPGRGPGAGRSHHRQRRPHHPARSDVRLRPPGRLFA